MEGLKRRLLALILTIWITKQANATQHVVGGSDGWDESTNYDSWAKSQTFKVGDTLVFKYTPGLHNVAEVGSERDYKTCDTRNAANSMSTGNDVVKLDKVGTRYFACATPGHCSAGMKLKVNIVSASSSSSSSSPSSPTSTSDVSSAYQNFLCSYPLMGLMALFYGVVAIFQLFVV